MHSSIRPSQRPDLQLSNQYYHSYAAEIAHVLTLDTHVLYVSGIYACTMTANKLRNLISNSGVIWAHISEILWTTTTSRLLKKACPAEGRCWHAAKFYWYALVSIVNNCITVWYLNCSVTQKLNSQQAQHNLLLFFSIHWSMQIEIDQPNPEGDNRRRKKHIAYVFRLFFLW